LNQFDELRLLISAAADAGYVLVVYVSIGISVGKGVSLVRRIPVAGILRRRIAFGCPPALTEMAVLPSALGVDVDHLV